MPRFEKLLRDQAFLAIVYMEAWQVSGDALLEDVARATLDAIERDFRNPKTGLFATGYHADSLVPRSGPEHLEGGHYVWTPDELRRLLGAKAGDLIAFHYGVKEEGNVPPELDPRGDFRGKSVLFQAHTASETQARFGLGEDELREALMRARALLLLVRSKRPPPRLDDRVITAYNGLAISALARGANLFGEERWRIAAIRAARALAARKTVIRTNSVPAQPDDYRLLIAALLDAYQVSFDVALLEKAVELQKIDPPPAHVPTSISGLATLPAREAAARFPPSEQIVVAGDPSADDTKALLASIRPRLTPDQMLFLIGSDRTRARLAALLPHLADVVPLEKQAVVAICREQSCGTPTIRP
jgi:uncharacterized protein YyaL (SSP411 family)